MGVLSQAMDNRSIMDTWSEICWGNGGGGGGGGGGFPFRLSPPRLPTLHHQGFRS